MSKKSKKTKTKTPFDVGLDMEQTLADSICDKFLQEGVEESAIDDAFVGAFKAFSHRMLTIFKKDFIFEIVSEMSQMVDEEHNEPYVCPDCQEKHKSNLAPVISIEAKNKLH